MTQTQDFQPLPKYGQSIKSNAAWVAVTLTRQDNLGISQILIIQPKR